MRCWCCRSVQPPPRLRKDSITGGGGTQDITVEARLDHRRPPERCGHDLDLWARETEHHSTVKNLPVLTWGAIEPLPLSEPGVASTITLETVYFYEQFRVVGPHEVRFTHLGQLTNFRSPELEKFLSGRALVQCNGIRRQKGPEKERDDFVGLADQLLLQVGRALNSLGIRWWINSGKCF